MLAELIHVPAHLGYAAVFIFIAVETMGIPVPGETALIAAALLAARGDLAVEWLIVVAASAAIIGDNIGFTIGRTAGRKFVERPGPFHKQRLDMLERGQPFFEKHGSKTVFLGRWVGWLRIASAWLAGINHMHWPTFLFWNALGGILWSASVVLAVYYLGEVVEEYVTTVGIVLGVAAGLALVAFLVWRRRRASRAR
jgi:membrane protein DedA with SNARE-associated domain